MNKRQKNSLKKDAIIIVLSIIVAALLLQTGLIKELLSLTQGLWFLDSFIAGLFFTSIFTTAPAIAAFSQIAQSSQSMLPMVIFGGLGALCGDLIIFLFMRNSLNKDIINLINYSGNNKLHSIFHLKIFRWLTFFFGALIIASPFPDELGLAMMGLSRTKPSILIPVSFIFNSFGILLIGLVAKSLLGN